MKSKKKLVLLSTLLEDIKKEIQSSFTDEELQSYKHFEDFFHDVDVQNGYEEEWNAKKYKPYYKKVWYEVKK